MLLGSVERLGSVELSKGLQTVGPLLDYQFLSVVYNVHRLT